MPTCRVWPDGAFGLSTIDRKFQMDALEPSREPSTHEVFIAKQIEVYGVEAVMEACVSTEKWRQNLEQLEEEHTPDYLDLTNVSNSLRTRRGQKGISRYGRLLVRNACFLMERANPLDTVTFLTTTLPPMDIHTNRYIVENWATVVKNFTLALGRVLRDGDLNGEIVGVTEVQEGRLSANADFIGLHLHLLFIGRRPYSTWVLTRPEVERLWRNAIGSVAKRIAETGDFSRSTNLQRLKVSGAAYIGKYLSKGVGVVAKIKEKNPDITLPACWYTCTISLRDKVKRLQSVGKVPATKIQDWIEAGETKYFTNLTTVSISGDDGREILIGWAGRLSERGRNALSLPFTPNGAQRTARLVPEGL